MKVRIESGKDQEYGQTEILNLLEVQLTENKEEIMEALKSLNEIKENYLEEYGDPENLSSDERASISEGLFYMATQWMRDGNQLMAEGLAVLSVRYM